MYAVGSNSTILHYDGNGSGQWAYFNTAGLEGTSYGLQTIWGTSSHDIFVGTSNRKILHYDGTEWTTFTFSISDLPGGNSSIITGFWGSSPHDVYAVTFGGKVAHYDGTSWSVITPVLSDTSQLNLFSEPQLNEPADLTSDVKLKAVYGISAESIYFAGDEGIVVHYKPDASECGVDSDCDAGYQCVEGECVPVSDNPPAFGDGPFLAAGPWPLLPTSAESAFVLDENYDVLWTFSDDFASCSEDCTHAAEYQAVGADTWTSLDVTANAAKGTARVTLPVESLQNATTYALRFAVTDCASQTTQSGIYYFRVATSDAPPVITGGPWLAAGTWPLLPTSAAHAMVLDQNYDVLWTFSDDYAFCSGLCTHRARYRKIVDDGSWIWEWLPVTTDATGMKHARVTLPIETMQPGDYMFYFDVRDCAGQRTSAPKVYYFKVEVDN